MRRPALGLTFLGVGCHGRGQIGLPHSNFRLLVEWVNRTAVPSMMIGDAVPAVWVRTNKLLGLDFAKEAGMCPGLRNPSSVRAPSSAPGGDGRDRRRYRSERCSSGCSRERHSLRGRKHRLPCCRPCPQPRLWAAAPYRSDRHVDLVRERVSRHRMRAAGGYGGRVRAWRRSSVYNAQVHHVSAKSNDRRWD
jgi:hypothetical protein